MQWTDLDHVHAGSFGESLADCLRCMMHGFTGFLTIMVRAWHWRSFACKLTDPVMAIQVTLTGPTPQGHTGTNRQTKGHSSQTPRLCLASQAVI